MLTTRETHPGPARQKPPLILSAGFYRQGDAGTMAPRRTPWQLGAAIVTALIITACGDSLSTGNAVLPNGAADDIGATARDEVEAAVSALTLPSSVDPLGTAQAPTAYSPGCVTPSTPADSDGDGVPDDAIYLFTAPPCRFTGWRGGTLDIVGQLRVQDPAPGQAGFGYEGTLTGLRTRFTTADNKVIYDVTRNGTRVLSGSVSSLLLSTDLQVTRTFAGKPDAAIDQQWTLTYMPEQSLQINTAIPGGTGGIGVGADGYAGGPAGAVRIQRAGSPHARPLREKARSDQLCSDLVELHVRVLGDSLENRKRADGVDAVTLHRDAGCLTDQGPRVQCDVLTLIVLRNDDCDRCVCCQ